MSAGTNGLLIECVLDPLALSKTSFSSTDIHDGKLTIDDILAYMCSPDLPHDTDALIARYREMASQISHRVIAAPNEPRILTKLVWPLRHAMSGYLTGNYLGSIALCGTVAEMLAILMYEAADVQLKSRKLSEREEAALFGSKYEKLGQQRRVEVLRALDIIDDELKAHFDKIRELRRKHLHLYTQDWEDLPTDAIKAIDTMIQLLAMYFPQLGPQGKFNLHPMLLKYLSQKGVVHLTDKPPGPPDSS